MTRYPFAALLLLTSTAAGTGTAAAAEASLVGADGSDKGTVTLTETPNGILLTARLKNLPEGVHGFHIHETGACTPDFGAAGGHLAGGAAAHGFLAEGGPHAGDMPNVHVPASGALTIEVFNPRVSFDSGEGALFDGDGSAIVIHAGADDYESQPSGDAGGRIACGVIER